ncbi:lipopolysaccharide biosynthesis protein [Winogradskyella sp. PC-19]|uniref:glycosyltransferase family 2 protein n=1 Tax=unclassified Winogradskyella TaxID=2615021 RepID=UPI000B3C32E7|nr:MULTISPECIES: glycosyltransferase family 2 protein [unclassified Winogradskyella]ARV10490.1 lipopolysaccharide biosynthesis protein [Winogradskyella sp. PC-19]
MKLSVIIPTYNEENYVEKAIRSVRFADEIIVVDSFSTDKTVEIAEKYNCKITQRKFDNFSNQKNHALQFASGEWVLFVDADERIPYALKSEIKAAMNSNKHAGYKLNFPHFYMNRFLYNHSDNVLRLVKRENCRFEGLVHEKLIIDGTVGQLKNPVLHFTYKGLPHYISKKDSYAWFQAEQMLKKGKKATYFHLAFKPFYRFFSSYILRRGFLDGIPGLTVATINAYGVFSRYVKLMLLQRGLK